MIAGLFIFLLNNFGILKSVVISILEFLMNIQKQMSKRIRLSGFFILFCCLAFQARAQYRFDSWTTDTGLPQNSVRLLAKAFSRRAHRANRRYFFFCSSQLALRLKIFLTTFARTLISKWQIRAFRRAESSAPAKRTAVS